VLFHLPQLASLTGREDEVDRFSVRLVPGADVDSAARRLAPFLPGARVVPTAEVARRSSTTFAVVQRFHRAIGIITLVAGAVFLACIMVLKVQERRGAVAALRLIGVSRRTLFAWILAEAALVSVVGGAIGIGLGEAASALINHHYRSVYHTALVFSRVTPGTIERALVLAVVLGLAAGAGAALHLLSRDPLREAQG
jgi:putative ABC transport system permease protein